MPEGHTIHREALDQQPMLVGQALAASSPQGRFLDGAARLDGQTCRAIDAFGKHLLYSFAGGDTLHLHLGLYGKFRATPRPAAEPRGAVRLRLESATHVVDVNGPNRCEILDPAGVAVLTARIGPDVLRTDADPDRAWRRIGASRTAIGTLIMDQSVMAGIGNIYRTEILWRQRLHPLSPGRLLARADFDRIWTDAAHLLRIGVEQRAIVTVDGATRSRHRYGARTNIFAKATCPRCGGPVLRFVLATRRAFVCEVCQPPPLP